VLKAEIRDVIIVCAGWEGQVNLEDTVFAGALIHKLVSSHKPAGDTVTLSLSSYHASKNNLTASLLTGNHAQRLIGMNLLKDIEYCFQQDLYDVVPELLDEEFTV